MRTYRKNCVPPFKANSDVLSGRVIKRYEIPRTKPGVFRVHAHGEFINAVHFDNVMKIVHDNEQTHFGVWTKRKDLVKWWLNFNDKPRNLTLIYSNPFVDTECELPDGFDKVFNVWTTKNDKINCHSKCVDCMLCYSHNKVTQIHEVIK
jgi:hypothetical protein